MRFSGPLRLVNYLGAIYFAMDFDPARSTDPITHTNRISEATALNLIDKYFQDISVYFNNYNQQHGTSYQVGRLWRLVGQADEVKHGIAVRGQLRLVDPEKLFRALPE
jgi:hypothetical protein